MNKQPPGEPVLRGRLPNVAATARKARDQAIVKRLMTGATPQLVAKEFWLTDTRILQIWRQTAGTTPRPWLSDVKRKERDRAIVERLTAGASPRVVANEFGLTVMRISQIWRQVTGTASRPWLRKTERDQAIAARLTAGASLRTVAKEFAITYQRVWQISGRLRASAVAGPGHGDETPPGRLAAWRVHGAVDNDEVSARPSTQSRR
jgi:uncharacterized protein (DUF433 family)